ncbi:MAG: hypothetical protein MJ169_03865 [Treponema sp.]|nr:hypothetical protein [Treponema sp.]
MAVVFYLGLIPALCVSIGYNVINSLLWIYKTGYIDPFILIYGICGILIVFSTWIIARNKEEFKITVPITLLYLVLIALASSMCSIISGGIIDFFHYKYFEITDMMNPIKKFTEGFIHQHFSLLASCILAQIPVSFLDRLIATFSGYGIYKICEKFIERR